jgi:hypothetical protein
MQRLMERVRVVGMTMASRTINIYIWESVEIALRCIRATMSLYFLDCTGLLFSLYKSSCVVKRHAKVQLKKFSRLKTD